MKATTKVNTPISPATTYEDNASGLEISWCFHLTMTIEVSENGIARTTASAIPIKSSCRNGLALWAAHETKYQAPTAVSSPDTNRQVRRIHCIAFDAI
jgi:hypothetical protein